MHSRAGRFGRIGVWLIYTGGLIGPLGGALVNAMLPELAADFDTSVDTVGTSITAFLLPYAVVMLWSGRLADRWGLGRSLRLGYAVYAVASVACALAPDIAVFLVARAGQGIANSLVTPVLIAVLARGAPPGRTGRTLGLFGSFQAAGQATAPALGGFAAEADWRLAFLGVAVTAALLGLAGARTGGEQRPADEPKPGGGPAGWVSLPGKGTGSRGRPSGLVLPSAVAIASYSSFIGLVLMGTLIAGDRFGAGSSARGAIAATTGIAGLAAGFVVGHFLDRFGPLRCGMVAGVLLAGAAALTAGSGHVALLVVAMALGGLAGTALRATTNILAVKASGREVRASGTSVVLAFQFLGGALAPLLWLPLYDRGPTTAVTVSGAGAVVAVLILAGSGARSRRVPRRPQEPSEGAGPAPRPNGHEGEPASRE